MLHPEMPRDAHPPSEIILKPQDQRIPKAEDQEVPGEGASLGSSIHPRVPAVGWKEGPRAVQAVTAQPCSRAGQACHTGWQWHSPWQGGDVPPGAAPTGALEILLFSTAVFVTVCVPLLGWSPMRQVIPKLFFITFSTGGE